MLMNNTLNKPSNNQIICVVKYAPCEYVYTYAYAYTIGGRRLKLQLQQFAPKTVIFDLHTKHKGFSKPTSSNNFIIYHQQVTWWVCHRISHLSFVAGVELWNVASKKWWFYETIQTEFSSLWRLLDLSCVALHRYIVYSSHTSFLGCH